MKQDNTLPFDPSKPIGVNISLWSVEGTPNAITKVEYERDSPSWTITLDPKLFPKYLHYKKIGKGRYKLVKMNWLQRRWYDFKMLFK